MHKEKKTPRIEDWERYEESSNELYSYLKKKGKHRKKKGVKSTEITISDDPTQQVRGYSVVNVISAKRGKYKKRDTGMSGQESVLSSFIRGENI